SSRRPGRLPGTARPDRSAGDAPLVRPGRWRVLDLSDEHRRERRDTDAVDLSSERGRGGLLLKDRPRGPIALSCVLMLAGAAGCGDRLVSGGFAGDATVRIHATAQLDVAVAQRPRVAALWLGYDAALNPLQSIETTVLPVSSVAFPPSFTFDLLRAPPSAGNYATHDGRIIPAEVRFARFAL